MRLRAGPERATAAGRPRVVPSGGLLLAVLVALCAGASRAATPAGDYADLLAGAVHEGLVDYARIRERRAVLDAYVASLEHAEPGPARYDRVAFWVNAYNALALQRVLDTRRPGDLAYRAIDVPGLWKEERWVVAGRRVSLDGIQKGILLKELAEPGAHFALNYVSLGGPPMQGRLWRADRLPQDFDQAARAFLADERWNHFDHVELIAELSPLFEWYRDDFRVEREGATVSPFQLWLAAHMPRETVARVLREVPWTFLRRTWDWTLNDEAVARAAARGGLGGGGAVAMAAYVLVVLALLAFGARAVLALRRGRRAATDPPAGGGQPL